MHRYLLWWISYIATFGLLLVGEMESWYLYVIKDSNPPRKISLNNNYILYYRGLSIPLLCCSVIALSALVYCFIFKPNSRMSSATLRITSFRNRSIVPNDLTVPATIKDEPPAYNELYTNTTLNNNNFSKKPNPEEIFTIHSPSPPPYITQII